MFEHYVVLGTKRALVTLNKNVLVCMNIILFVFSLRVVKFRSPSAPPLPKGTACIKNVGLYCYVARSRLSVSGHDRKSGRATTGVWWRKRRGSCSSPARFIQSLPLTENRLSCTEILPLCILCPLTEGRGP